MIDIFSTKGTKYSLHIKDATSVGGKNIVRYSLNETDELLGVTCLMPEVITVDELVELIKQHFGVE